MKKILPPVLSLLIVCCADNFIFPVEDEHLRDSSTPGIVLLYEVIFNVILTIIWIIFHSTYIVKNIEYHGRQGLLVVVLVYFTSVILFIAFYIFVVMAESNLTINQITNSNLIFFASASALLFLDIIILKILLRIVDK